MQGAQPLPQQAPESAAAGGSGMGSPSCELRKSESMAQDCPPATLCAHIKPCRLTRSPPRRAATHPKNRQRCETPPAPPAPPAPDQLRDALHRLNHKGCLTPVPAADHQLALVIGVNQTDQIAQHDAVFVAQARARQDDGGQAGVKAIKRPARRRPPPFFVGPKVGNVSGLVTRNCQLCGLNISPVFFSLSLSSPPSRLKNSAGAAH